MNTVIWEMLKRFENFCFILSPGLAGGELTRNKWEWLRKRAIRTGPWMHTHTLNPPSITAPRPLLLYIRHLPRVLYNEASIVTGIYYSRLQMVCRVVSLGNLCWNCNSLWPYLTHISTYEHISLDNRLVYVLMRGGGVWNCYV